MCHTSQEGDAGEFAVEVGGVAGAVLGVVEDGVNVVEDVPLGDGGGVVVGAELFEERGTTRRVAFRFRIKSRASTARRKARPSETGRGRRFSATWRCGIYGRPEVGENFNRAYGTGIAFPIRPATEVAGYRQSPRWGCDVAVTYTGNQARTSSHAVPPMEWICAAIRAAKIEQGV